MTNEHPITPPPELMEEWRMDYIGRGHTFIDVATKVIQWSADRELEACCEVLARELICDGKHVATDLRMIRRPKPLSLKEQAFQALCRFQAAEGHESCTEEEIVDDFNTIRRALEALDD